MYIYMYIYMILSLSLCLAIYIFMYIDIIYVHEYIYIYIYIYVAIYIFIYTHHYVRTYRCTYIHLSYLCLSTVVKDSTIVLGTTTMPAAFLLCGWSFHNNCAIIVVGSSSKTSNICMRITAFNISTNVSSNICMLHHMYTT